MPVYLRDGHKPANVRCGHLCAKGCKIYDDRSNACQYWSCRWLFDASTTEMRRPEKSGYIIDPLSDTVLVDGREVEVVQVWCDPARSDAHRDPALRPWLAEQGSTAMVRYGRVGGFMLLPPTMMAEREWGEIETTLNTEIGRFNDLPTAEKKVEMAYKDSDIEVLLRPVSRAQA